MGDWGKIFSVERKQESFTNDVSFTTVFSMRAFDSVLKVVVDFLAVVSRYDDVIC